MLLVGELLRCDDTARADMQSLTYDTWHMQQRSELLERVPCSVCNIVTSAEKNYPRVLFPSFSAVLSHVSVFKYSNNSAFCLNPLLQSLRTTVKTRIQTLVLLSGELGHDYCYITTAGTREQLCRHVSSATRKIAILEGTFPVQSVPGPHNDDW